MLPGNPPFPHQHKSPLLSLPLLHLRRRCPSPLRTLRPSTCPPAYPLPWDQGEYDPLWGDLDADAPIINRLLRAIEGGMPVEAVEVDVDEKTHLDLVF